MAYHDTAPPPPEKELNTLTLQKYSVWAPPTSTINLHPEHWLGIHINSLSDEYVINILAAIIRDTKTKQVPAFVAWCNSQRHILVGKNMLRPGTAQIWARTSLALDFASRLLTPKYPQLPFLLNRIAFMQDNPPGVESGRLYDILGEVTLNATSSFIKECCEKVKEIPF